MSVWHTQVGTLNYMPPEAIKDTSSQGGKARSKVLPLSHQIFYALISDWSTVMRIFTILFIPLLKISPKGDVWSLGCILYCMTYGKTPFQSITNQIAKLHAIIDPSHKIEFPDIAEKDLLHVLKVRDYNQAQLLWCDHKRWDFLDFNV